MIVKGEVYSRSDVHALVEENERLRKALEPFAQKLAEIEPDSLSVSMGMARPVSDMRDEELALLTVGIGHLRAARAALEAP